MEMGNFIKVVVAAVMMIVIVTVVVVPVLQDAGYEQLGDNTETGKVTTTVASGSYAPSATGFTIDGTEAATADDKDWILISDTCAIFRWSSSAVLIMDCESTGQAVQSNKVTIDGDAGTWSCIYSGTTYSGNIGANPIVRSATGDMGFFDNQAFYLNQSQQIKATVVTSSFTVGETIYNTARFIISGTADSLQVDGVCAVTSNGTVFLDASTATATISSGLSEPNDTVFSIGANPTVSVTVTISGTEITKTNSEPVIFSGPLTYTQVTDDGSAIKSMLDIVPLLMIVGVVIMIIAAVVLRR